MLSLTILTPALMLLYSALAITFQVRPVNWFFAPALQISSLVTASRLAAGAGRRQHFQRSPGKNASHLRPALAPNRNRQPANRARASNI